VGKKSIPTPIKRVNKTDENSAQRKKKQYDGGKKGKE